MPFLRLEGNSLRVEPSFAQRHKNLLLALGIIIMMMGAIFVLYGWAHFSVNSNEAFKTLAEWSREEISTEEAYGNTQINLREMVDTQPYIYLGMLLAVVGVFLSFLSILGRVSAQIDDELYSYKIEPEEQTI